jgi:hypothetical protein
MTRSYTTTTGDYLSARVSMSARTLLWISPKNRSTGATETIGLWTGYDDLTFTIDGVDRLYYGAGPLISVDAITMTTGLQVQMQKVRLSMISDAVQQAIRTYDTRLAPVEIHRALFTDDTLIDAPVRVFKGWCDSINITREAEGGSFYGDMTLASAARALTRSLATTKSDADLRRRSSTDAFRKYASIAAAVPYYWGMNGPTPTASGTASTSSPTSASTTGHGGG